MGVKEHIRVRIRKSGMHPNGLVKDTLVAVTEVCVPEVESQAVSWEKQHQGFGWFQVDCVHLNITLL